MYDIGDIFIIPSENLTIRKHIAAKNQINKEPDSFEMYSEKWAAIVDSIPFHIPVNVFLLPYGGGAFSSLEYFSRKMKSYGFSNFRQKSHSSQILSEAFRPGIPNEVFFSQWRRLSSGFSSSHTIRCCLSADKTLLEVIDYLLCNLKYS
jgi:hypothetical protein